MIGQRLIKDLTNKPKGEVKVKMDGFKKGHVGCSQYIEGLK